MASRRWPKRPLEAVEPLLTAAEAYPALERATLAAQRRVWLWFRLFDPGMRLADPEVRAAVGETWSDLIAHRLAAGVEVALAVSDFDPAARPGLHAQAWRAVRLLTPLVPQGLALLVADHAARPGLLWRLPGKIAAALKIEKLRRAMNAGESPWTLDDLPALQGPLGAEAARVVWRSAATPPLKPGTHHQKVAVFDEDRAILGGLDVNPRRWDEPEHRRPADETWRDLSVVVSGPIATDAAAHLARLWNDAARRSGGDGPPPLEPPPAAPDTVRDGPRLRLSATVSGLTEDPRDLGPKVRERDLEADHLALIRSAKRFLYIETQFFRSRRIARALARRAARNPDLGVILVLPAAPDDVAFERADGLDARFGEWLQGHCVRRVLRAFRERAAVLSPARAAPRSAEDRSALGGAGIVYVHTKTIIADDEAAIVSSANLNGRSLRWDTEAGVLIRSPEVAGGVRRRLSETLLPDDAPAKAFAADAAAPGLWAGIAARNAGRAPARRDGLLMPFPLRRTEDFGQPAPAAPEELV